MIILLFIALSLSNFTSSVMLKKTSALAANFQQKCTKLVPLESKNPQVMSSLVCGENLTEGTLKENLVKTSLIHIFVISGSHLILIDELLGILKIPFFLRFLFLGFYSLVVGWQPPAVRALIALGTRRGLKALHCYFPPDLMTLIAGCFTLALFPAWWQSSSLVMSWCAALALCWVPLLRIKNKFLGLLLSQVAIFLFMVAPLWGLGSLHPLSLIYNVVLGPVISFVLLPLGFAAVLMHPLTPLFDGALFVFAKILSWSAEPITLSRGSSPSLPFLWCWALAWQCFFHLLRLRLYHGKDAR